jgi:hypothetical protein
MDGKWIWTACMIVVLIAWTVWLQLDIAHPEAERRARWSLALVVAIAIALFIIIASDALTLATRHYHGQIA